MQDYTPISKKKGPPGAGRASFQREKVVKALQQELERADIKIPKYLVEQLVPVFFNTLKTLILENNNLALRGFGTISMILNKGKIITHPETKEEYIAVPHYKINFKPEAAFKRLLQEKAKKEVQKL